MSGHTTVIQNQGCVPAGYSKVCGKRQLPGKKAHVERHALVADSTDIGAKRFACGHVILDHMQDAPESDCTERLRFVDPGLESFVGFGTAGRNEPENAVGWDLCQCRDMACFGLDAGIVGRRFHKERAIYTEAFG